MENRLARLIKTKAENVVQATRVDFSFMPAHENFPLVITSKTSGLILTEWVKENKELFEEKLNIHGGILLRGFNINTVEKFQQFIDTFNITPLEYKQRSSPRFEVAKNIYHSTTYPEDQHINMHSENSYAKDKAMRIVFCCIQPSEEQGETPIADNRKVVQFLSAQTRDKFLKKGVRYVRNISKGIGLSWQEVFQTSDRNEVEEECRRNEMSFRWDGEDKLVLSWQNQAIYEHPETKELVWFNHAFFFNKYAMNTEVRESFGGDDEFPFHTYYGDGTEITWEEIEEIRAAYEQATMKFLWAKGDVLFLDNMLTAHGRSPFKGAREIIVSMF